MPMIRFDLDVGLSNHGNIEVIVGDDSHMFHIAGVCLRLIEAHTVPGSTRLTPDGMVALEAAAKALDAAAGMLRKRLGQAGAEGGV